MLHYHVISLTDPAHHSAGYQDPEAANQEAIDRGDDWRIIQCQHPDCELTTTSHSGGSTA